MKDIQVAYSYRDTLPEIAGDIKTQCGNTDYKLLIYFASSLLDQKGLAHELQRTFPGTALYGCSTAGEIVSGHMLKNSVVAMAFSEHIIEDLAIEVIEGIKDSTRDELEEKIRRAFDSFETHFACPVRGMDFRRYVGLVLIDGMSRTEEKVMDIVGDLTDVIFTGASAGDDERYRETWVHFNGDACSNAAVLAILKPRSDFSFLKTQSFCNTGKQLHASRVDEKNRVILEFNGKPAVKAYAEAVGTSPDRAKDFFMTHPLGLMITDEPYVRSPHRVEGEGIVFFCNIMEGMELELLRSTDIIEDTGRALKEKQAELGTISGIINFHCILRTLELEQKGLTEPYGRLFEIAPTIGFSTYGEEYIGHINQTSTMLIFK